MSTQSNIILNKLINTLVKAGASRLHLEVGAKPVVRADQKLINLEEEAIISDTFLQDVVDIILSKDKHQELADKKSIIATYTFEGKIRFKVHVFYQKNNLSIIFTYIPSVISDPASIGLSQEFIDLTHHKNGLLVIAGYHSSGRSTTVLSLLNYINTTRAKYILTIEEPIEYILTSQKSIIEQREVGRDANSFISALQFSKDSDVDIIYLSEVKDYQTLAAVIDIVSSGRLVIIITEASSSADAVAKLIEMAPDNEADNVRHALIEFLLGVAVQQLVPRRGGGQITVTEILISNAATTSLIKEGRYSQLTSVIQTSRDEGMRSLDQSLLELVKTNEVDYQVALQIAVNKVDFQSSAQKFRLVK